MGSAADAAYLASVLDSLERDRRARRPLLRRHGDEQCQQQPRAGPGLSSVLSPRTSATAPPPCRPVSPAAPWRRRSGRSPLPDGRQDLYIRADCYHAQFAADSPPTADAVDGRNTKARSPSPPSRSPPTTRLWRRSPSRFLFGAEDRNIPVAVHRFMAERAGSRRTIELAGGSHTVAIPEAATVVELIEEAAMSDSASQHALHR